MANGQAYEFGTFRLDPEDRLLSRAGQQVPLTPKAADTLLYLVEHREHTVGKEELIQNVWGGAFVEDGSLSQTIWMLRKALGDTAEGPQFITTVPKRGYRFVARVREVADSRRILPGLASEPYAAEARVLRSSAAPLPSLAWARWPAIVLTALLAAGAVITWWRAATPRARDSSRVMLAVLPVQNLTGDPARQYVTDGLTEEMIAQLGAFNPRRLGVIARTSSMAFRDTTKTVDEIGRELGVDYVLETSLREGPGTFRFTAQLVRTSDQTHLWARSYERSIQDVLSMEADLAQAVADEIRVGLPPEREVQAAPRRAVKPEAYDAFIQGRYHWNKRSAEEVRTGIEYFKQAATGDPDFAPAFAGLADSYTLLTMMRNAPPAEMIPRAKDALLKALALDDSLASAHTVLGEVTEVFDWNWGAAEKEFQRAIELDPNNAEAHHQFAIHLATMGRFPQALSQIEQARRLDPVSPVMMTSTGWILVRGRRPQDAIRECRKALDQDSKFARGHLCIGEAKEELGDLQGAAEEFLAARTLTGMPAPDLTELGRAIREAGYQGYFRVRLRQLDAKAGHAYVSPYDRADFSLRAGDKVTALHWLEAAFQERSPYLVFLQIEPRMDGLRSDPAFQELLRRIGLAGILVSPPDARQPPPKAP